MKRLTKAMAIALLSSTITISSVGCNITPKATIPITTQVEDTLDNEQEVYFNDGILAVKVHYNTPVYTLINCFKAIDDIAENVDLSDIIALQFWAVETTTEGNEYTLLSCTIGHDQLKSLSMTRGDWTRTKDITGKMLDLYISSDILDTLTDDEANQIIYNTYYKIYNLPPDVDLNIVSTGKLYKGKN